MLLIFLCLEVVTRLRMSLYRVFHQEMLLLKLEEIHIPEVPKSRPMPSFSLRLLLLLLTSNCLFIFTIQAQSPFPWPEGKKAALSLSFDDARASQVLVGKELFRRLNVKATFYVNPAPVETYLDDWKEMVADGHEIGNHTVYHPCTGNFNWSRHKALEDYSIYSMKQELLSAQQQIHSMLGVTPVSFAYTCGNTYVGRGTATRSMVPLIAELFESGRGWLNEAPNDPQFMDMAQVMGTKMDNQSFEELKEKIDQAVAHGHWLVLAGHEIGKRGSQTTYVEFLEAVISYAQDPANGIWLAPVGEVARYVQAQREAKEQKLKEALIFYSSFDQGIEADYAKGDATLYTAPNSKQKHQGVPGLIAEEVSIAKGKGRFGNALEFKRKGEPILYYSAKDNMTYSEENWSGTISLWMSLTPDIDLAPGYTDPIQITDQGYDDAAFWVDFSDKNPRSFRMGVFGDVAVWNPEKKSPGNNPDFDNRLVAAKGKPFQRGRWTHVVVSFSGINSDKGKATLYLNGEAEGSREITEPFHWEYEKAKIFLGLSYVGLLDEIAIFDRELEAGEVKSLYGLVEHIEK